MAEVKSEKRQALDLAISQIERQFGKGSVMRLGAKGALEEIATIPTGALSLDVALGVGGLPRGRVIEIYGPESSGKTTLALQVIAEMQKLGGTAAFIDAEHALDPQYAQKLGVKVEDLLISQPDNGEQALEITDMLVRSASVDVVVIDSVAALTPKAEIEGEMGDAQMGLHARLMSQALRKLTGNIKSITELNLKVRPKLLRDLNPGTRVVSHAFSMGDWKPERTADVSGTTVYLWRIPPRKA